MEDNDLEVAGGPGMSMLGGYARLHQQRQQLDPMLDEDEEESHYSLIRRPDGKEELDEQQQLRLQQQQQMQEPLGIESGANHYSFLMLQRGAYKMFFFLRQFKSGRRFTRRSGGVAARRTLAT